MKITKSNKKILFILISLSIIFVVIISIGIIKKIDSKYINFEKTRQDFEDLKSHLNYKGYEIEINNLENLIVIKRDNIKMYFGSEWIKTEFDYMISLNKKYKITNLVINNKGKFCKKCHYIMFKSYEIATNKELNNFFDFDYTIIDWSPIKTGFPGLDDGFIESFFLFENEVMSIIELDNYCNEAKSLERYLANRY